LAEDVDALKVDDFVKRVAAGGAVQGPVRQFVIKPNYRYQKRRH
jgi:hypothetical protein